MARNNEPAFRAENALAHLFDSHGNPISMYRLQRQRFQDEHIERALDEITRLVWHKPCSHWLPGGTYAFSTGCQEEKTPKFMRKRPENSWRQANSQGVWRKLWRKDGIERGTKNGREAGMGTWPLGFELLSFLLRLLAMWRFQSCALLGRSAGAVHFGLRQLRPDA